MTDAIEALADARDAGRGIGSTDTPKILGLSKYGTALTVYERLVDPQPDSGMSLPAWLGLRLQAAVAEMYQVATGDRVRADRRTHWHPTIPYLFCHLDYRKLGPGGSRYIVECKTRAYMRGWGDADTEDIPPDVWAQVQHQMLVTDAHTTDVAVLFGHHTFRRYIVPRNEPFLTSLVEELARFWAGYEARIPPPVSGSDLDSAWLRRHFPQNDGTIRVATPEQEAIIDELVKTRYNVTQAQAVQAKLENRVRELIGDADGVEGPFGTITWKKSKDGVDFDWERVAAIRAEMVDELLAMADPGDDPEYVARLGHIQLANPTLEGLYSRPRPGSRRMHYALTEE
jgi:predicted phage-related endonuclease